MRDDNEAGLPRRARLPGNYYQRASARESGVRNSRRAATWTAAALIGFAAATTGYLAHAASAPTATVGTSVGHTGAGHGQPGSASQQGPHVHGPVVTSGGSGVAGGVGGAGGASGAGGGAAGWSDN